MAAVITIGSLSARAILHNVPFDSSVFTFARISHAFARISGKLFTRRPFVRAWLVIPSPARESRAFIMSGVARPSLTAFSRYWRATSLLSLSSEFASSVITTSSTLLRYSLSTDASFDLLCATAANEHIITARPQAIYFVDFIKIPLGYTLIIGKNPDNI